ncbi:MAG: 2-hydroxyacid dehydrogenase [Rhodoferax sp.]|nr:2-hydroxyacid dehydrogenase [Rhodoferax sp.]
MSRVACLDVWAPAVRDVVRRTAPPELSLHFADSYDADAQCALAAGADILLPGFAPVTARMLCGAPKVRMIQKWGIGIDAIDLDSVRRHGVALAITTGANAGPVAELAIALMLAVYRRIPYVNRAMREGRWPTPEMRETCFQISGKTVGLVGFGHIGRMLAHRLRGFDAQVVYADIRRADFATEQALQARQVPLDELLRDSDIVSLHAPLVAQTARMINARTIAGMKDGAVLINTARGGLVDEVALAAALVSGKLRGAGLDAFDPEPPSPDNPLLSLEQVVVTPHAGGGVFDNVAHVAGHAFGNILRFLRGDPLPAADLVIAAPSPAGGG